MAEIDLAVKRRDGYRRHNRPDYGRGFDPSRHNWQHKLTHWRRPLKVDAQHHCFAVCVCASILIHSSPVAVAFRKVVTTLIRPPGAVTFRIGVTSRLPLRRL